MTNEEMFNSNVKLAYKIAARYLNNYKNDYEDIKQIALLKLWEATKTFNGSNAFSTYAWTVMSNGINMYLRSFKKKSKDVSFECKINENLTIADTLKSEFDCESVVEDRILVSILNEKMLIVLSDTERKVLEDKLCGKRQKQTATELNISQKNVSVVGNRAINKLKEAMAI